MTGAQKRKNVPEGRRPCPICGQFMTSTQHYGNLTDVCQAHGVWVDKDEIRSVLDRIKKDDVQLNLHESQTLTAR